MAMPPSSCSRSTGDTGAEETGIGSGWHGAASLAGVIHRGPGALGSREASGYTHLVTNGQELAAALSCSAFSISAMSMSWSSWPPISLRRPASNRILAPETP